jgi:hypothetical protein
VMIRLSPILSMVTSVVSKRNSLGILMAWLPPEVKTLLVVMALPPYIHLSIYSLLEEHCKRQFPAFAAAYCMIGSCRLGPETWTKWLAAMQAKAVRASTTCCAKTAHKMSILLDKSNQKSVSEDTYKVSAKLE